LGSKIEAPHVRELLARRDELKAQLAKKVEKLESAQAELKESEREHAALQSKIAERNLELARSGARPPEGPFQEEVEIEKVERRERFHKACVQVCQEDLAASQAELGKLGVELKTALSEFLTEGFKEAKEQYISGAVALGQLYEHLGAWSSVCKFAGTFAEQVPGALLAGFDGHMFIDSRHRYRPSDLGSSLMDLWHEVCELPVKAQE
jgi:hypothetical protein